MANVIRIKRKTTAGAPALGALAVGEMCVVIPDERLYLKKDAATLLEFPEVGALGGGGDMLASTYDPGSVAGDAFDMDNMVEGTNLILTAAERAAITANTAKPTQASITAEIGAAVNALVSGAPGALDTLNELAAAMGDDANFSATVTAQLATKLDDNSTIDGGSIS